jgi:hypothetical protein
MNNLLLPRGIGRTAGCMRYCCRKLAGGLLHLLRIQVRAAVQQIGFSTLSLTVHLSWQVGCHFHGVVI